MTSPLFTRRSLALAVALIGGSALCYLGLVVFGPDTSREACAPDAKSVSALGHRGLVELLRALDRPVVVRHGGASELINDGDGVVVLIEPDASLKGIDERLGQILRTAGNLLVVLPKRGWMGSLHDGRWIDEPRMRDPASVERILHSIDRDLSLIHAAPKSSLVVVPSEFKAALPDIDDLQLVKGGKAGNVIVGGDAGTLVLELKVKSADVTVLSDPDVFANHGLARGNNAAFAVALLDRLRGDGPVVIDESVHPSAFEPGFTKRLGEFPLVLLLAQLVLFGLAILWRAYGRFGAPAEPPSRMGRGKASLIENIAGLLRYGGNSGPVLERYAGDRVRETAARLRAPAGMQADEQAAWLVERSRKSRFPEALDRVLHNVKVLAHARPGARVAADITQTARRLHRVLSEISHGSR